MNLLRLTLALTLTALAASPVARAADSASVHAILINASNKKGGVDSRLSAYEAELRRNLPFNTFRFAGEGTVTVGATGKSTLRLPGGNHLNLDGSRRGNTVHLKVQWMNGAKVVINTTLTLRPGVPAVLGRRGGDDGETPVVLVIAN